MFFWLQRLQKMATPLKEGYYFGSASLNKKSRAPETIGSRMSEGSRRSRYWFFEKVSFVSSENMWHPTRGYWCASGGVVIVARHPLDARSSGAVRGPPRSFSRERKNCTWYIGTFVPSLNVAPRNSSRRILLYTLRRIAIAG